MIVHRLDMATSGCVIMARTDAALKDLNRQVISECVMDVDYLGARDLFLDANCEARVRPKARENATQGSAHQETTVNFLKVLNASQPCAR